MISPIEEIIEEARAGNMFILVDDESRENEGDLVIPAACIDADKINFMARFGRGLICLAMTKQQVQKLSLPLMPQRNASRQYTAFTISIEAREGVTTGISASDRARTIMAAIASDAKPEDIATPGHIFPLEAREGGVLVRAGHTEAAVDIARLAGHGDSGVICEIMNDDGTMARLPDLVEFAAEHGLKIGKIADLIAYRRKHETLVERGTDTFINSCYGGKFRAVLYRNTIEYAEHIALIKGGIIPTEPVLVRMHALDVLSDALGAGSESSLQKAMEHISAHGSGVIVLLREPRRNTLSRALEATRAEDGGDRQKAKDSPLITQHHSGLRDYGIGAQILLDLGIRRMNLLSNSSRTIIALEGYGLEICSHIPLD